MTSSVENQEGQSPIPPEEVVVGYHERTKHHFHRHAASLGYMDWAAQPDPFRRYQGSELIRLPMPRLGNPLPYRDLFEPGAVRTAPTTLDSISLFFRYALSLTAWKQFKGESWALRANPSSGNLHPTEGYAILPVQEGDGNQLRVHHYAPKEHALEQRGILQVPGDPELRGAFGLGAFLVGLTSIHWREAWKYGERAFRYCQHDVGHALAALRFAAAALGWKVVLLDKPSGPALGDVLGLSQTSEFARDEAEEPDLLAWVFPGNATPPPRALDGLGAAARNAQWFGRANTLSPEHGISWPVLDEMAQATRHRGSLSLVEDIRGLPSWEELHATALPEAHLTAEQAILGRRSAVAMDGSTTLPKERFFNLLARLVPTCDRRSVPWDTIPWRPRVHLGLFVHRVVGIPAGLYALVRDPSKLATLKQAFRADFRWDPAPGCPTGLPLYLLQEGDMRTTAASLSCGQDIAGQGVFSLGMIAEFMDSLATHGAAFYRNLFWEAGMVGQVLYLEAEDAGVRGTGIGCYYDDPVHAIFGITSRDWQSLYHFTVGGAVDDARLTTRPAYEAYERLASLSPKVER